MADARRPGGKERGNQGALRLGPDPSSPPATRAECPTQRPCPHLACRHNLAVDRETPGRPHHGTHNAPRRARDGGCALDVATEGEHTTRAVAGLLGVSTRRVQQVEGRARAKVLVATSLLEHVEEWAERVIYPIGGVVDHLWGVVVDEDGVQHTRAGEVDMVYVTIAVDVSKVRRT